jgi:two-component system, NarL family, sensor histidine kinase UhpB
VNALPAIRILLVEDSATDALLIGEALSELVDCRPQLTHAEALAAGLDHAHTTQFDIALLDLGLPDTQGIGTFRAFRQRAPDLPVIVLTGLDDMSVGLLAIQEGAQDYLLKRQIDAPLLSRAIRYAIERHRIAAALAASEERFQLAVSGASAGLWDWNLLTGAMYLSPHCRDIIGYGESDPPGDAMSHYDAIHSDDLDRVIAHLNAHLKHRDPYNVEYRVCVERAEIRWIQSRGQALWNGSGEPYRMVGWFLDITDRKEAEEAIKASREELRLLSAKIQQVREEEKTRLARDLHDDLGQQLAALNIEVTLAQHALEVDRPASPEVALRPVYAMTSRLAESMRRIAADLRPVMLDDLGLIPAIEWLVSEFSARYGVRVNHRFDVRTAFSRESATAIFRMIQEALNNIARHSGATEATVEMIRDGVSCIVRVTDNGQGTETGMRRGPDSFGLLGMRERAARLGGTVHIESASGRGFSVTITLPLAAIEASDGG